MTPDLANPNPQYSLTGLRLRPEAGLRNPAAQARLQARPVRAYVRGPAGRRRGGARAAGPGRSHGRHVGLSTPAALHGFAGWEAQRLADLPAWLRWITVFRPGYCSMGDAPLSGSPSVALVEARVTLPPC